MPPYGPVIQRDLSFRTVGGHVEHRDLATRQGTLDRLEGCYRSRTTTAVGLEENSHPLALLTCVAALIGVVSGVLEIAIPGVLAQQGRPDLAGWLLATMLCSSAAASIISGMVS